MGPIGTTCTRQECIQSILFSYWSYMYPNMNSGCHHHQIAMDFLYDAIFKMAAS